MKLAGIACFLLALLIVLALVIFMVARATRSSSPAERVARLVSADEAKLVQEYNRHIGKAASHTRRGHMGQANVYVESAERIARLIEKRYGTNVR
jgi:hypothetical protein